MRRSITLFCAIFFTTLLISQPSVYPKIPFTLLNKIAVEDNTIFTTGNCETAILSTDGGSTLEYFELPFTDYIQDLFIVPGSSPLKAYILTSKKLYYFGSDKSITPIDVNAIDNFGDFIAMEVNAESIIIISEGAIYKSPHNNMQWSKLTDVVYNSNYFITETSLAGDKILIASNEGQIFSTDLISGGYNQIVNVGSRIYALEMANNMVGYMITQNATVPQKTVDGGMTWSGLTGWPENNSNLIVYDEDIFITANTNRYFISMDGGMSSSSNYITDPNIDLIYDGIFSPDGTLYFSGRSSTLLKSDDFGLNYENLNDYSRETWNEIEISDGGLAVAQGNYGLLVSQNGGLDWEEDQLPELFENNGNLDGVAILSNTKYVLGHSNGVVLVDNGSIVATTGSRCNDLLYNASGNYILAIMSIGNNQAIAKSKDGGMTWENKVFSSTYIDNLKIADDGTIYTSYAQDRYLKSTDDGENWTEVAPSIAGYINDLAFLNGFGLFSINGRLYKSNDGGQTLEQIAQGYFLANLFIMQEDHFLYTTGSNSQTNIYEKRPGETAFTVVETWCGESFSSFRKDDIIWYGKVGGHLNTYKVKLSTGVNDNHYEEISISPNILSSGEEIFLDINHQNRNIRIMDSMGKLVYQNKFVNGSLQISTDGWSKGIYFLSSEGTGVAELGKIVIY